MTNVVVLIGRLTKDLEIRKTQTGKSVASFTLAVNRNKDEADFINCVAWNQTAELMSKYTGKGSQIGIEGRVQTRNYEDNTGKKVYVTEIVVDRVEFLSKKETSEEYQEPYQEQYQNKPIDISNDDLPF